MKNIYLILIERARSQGGFDAEILPAVEQVLDLAQHEAAGRNIGAFRRKRRQVFGEFVGVDKLYAVQQLRKNPVRCGGFPGAVRTRNDIKSGHAKKRLLR